MRKSWKSWNAAKEACFLWVLQRLLRRERLYLWVWSYTQIYLQLFPLVFCLCLIREFLSLLCSTAQTTLTNITLYPLLSLFRPSCNFFSPFNCSFHKNSSPEWGDLYRKSSLVRSNRALPFISKVLLSIGLRENSFSAHLSHCATSSLLQ